MTTQASPPREPSWVALAAAQIALLAWLVLLAVGDAVGPSRFALTDRAGSAVGTAVVGIFGFAVPAVFGMFPRLAPGLLGLPRAPRSYASASSLTGAGLALAAVLWLVVGGGFLIGVLGVLSAAGGTVLVLTLVRLRGERTSDVPIAAPSPAVALPANLMMGAALAYLIAGGASLATIAFAPRSIEALGLRPAFAWPLHLVTAGFIALSVFSIGCRMFAAFSGAQAPRIAVWVAALAGSAAPLGIASALASGNLEWIALPAIVGLAASVSFLVIVLWMYRHQRRPRAAWQLLVAGAFSLVAGEALGALIGVEPELLRYAALHAQVNVVGFTGLTVFGVLFLLSGGEAARPGAYPPAMAIAFLWPAALAVRALALVADWVPLLLLGDAVLVFGYLAAARASHGRRRRPPPAP